MAHIRKRTLKSGAIAYQVRWQPYADGREVSRQFPRLGDAREFKRRIENELAQGTYVDPKRGAITFGEYVSVWQESRHVRPATRKHNTFILKHVLPILDTRKLAGIRRSDIQGVINRAAERLAPSSVGGIRTFLRTIFNDAVKDQIIPRSPVIDIKVPETPKRDLVIPTREQVDMIADALPERYRLAVWIAAGTGLRVGEIAGLCGDGRDVETRGGVDYFGRAIRVRQQARGAALKTPASRRTIPLAASLVTMISEHVARFPSDDGYLITNRKRVGVSRDLLSNIMSDAMADLPFERGTGWHILRHFYASALIRAGLDPKTVQRRMGHESISITFDTYGHLWPDADDRSRAAVESIFAESVGSPSQGPGTVESPSLGSL